MAIIINKKPKKSPIAANTKDFADIPDPFGFGQRAVDFLRSLKHPKSRLPDHAFQLDPWQERIVRRIYGPCDEHRNRIVRTVCILVPRGNRKTSIAGALALLHANGPESFGGEINLAACDQKQALIAFRESEAIVQATWPAWKKGTVQKRFDSSTDIKVTPNLKNIRFPNGSFIEAISADAASQHGRSPAVTIADEVHAWPKRDLWDVIRTGLVKTPGSLLVVITTAGRGQEGFAYEFIDYARKVARGDVKDPSFLPILYETPLDADWKDEKVWHAANPGLSCGYPDLAGLRQMAREAEHRPADREAFKQLYLNMWLEGTSDPFVEMGVYDQCNGPVNLEAMEGLPCWLAVDLSSVSDLTAIVACWRNGDDYFVHPWFFCPEKGLHLMGQQDGVPYQVWADQGLIKPTPGNGVDYDYVEDKIKELCKRFDVREIAFDPWGAKATLAHLLDAGLPVVEMRQGVITMAPAVKELERAIISGRFHHAGHPILRWNFSNIAVEIDKAENKTFHKGNSKARIDGAQACAMAVGRASLGGEKGPSIFSDPNNASLFLW